MPGVLRRSPRSNIKPYDHPAEKRRSATPTPRPKKAAKPKKSPKPAAPKIREQPMSDDECAVILLMFSQGQHDLAQSACKAKEESVEPSPKDEPSKPVEATPALQAAAQKPESGGAHFEHSKIKKTAAAAAVARTAASVKTKAGGSHTSKRPSPLRKEIAIPRTMQFPSLSPTSSPSSFSNPNPHNIVLRIPTTSDK